LSFKKFKSGEHRYSFLIVKNILPNRQVASCSLKLNASCICLIWTLYMQYIVYKVWVRVYRQKRVLRINTRVCKSYIQNHCITQQNPKRNRFTKTSIFFEIIQCLLSFAFVMNNQKVAQYILFYNFVYD
jgi:hypothetical protein